MPAIKNILGPDPTRGATLTRPARVTGNYNAPYWFNRCTDPSDPAQTKLTADWFNSVMATLREFIWSSGVAEGESLDDMVAEAAARYASVGTFGEASGSANAIVVVASGNTVPPKSYFNGMRIHCMPAATNTGPTVANVFGLGDKAVRTWNDQALAGDELLVGRHTVWEYKSGANAGAGAWLVLPWARPDTRINTIGNLQVFSTPGTYTFTVPAGITQVESTVIAAGGAGGASGDGSGGGVAGNAGAGGGGGGYAVKLCTVTSSQAITVTVGAGGTAGAGSGGNGGSSSFGPFCSATGGRGGVSGIGSTQPGGTGGTATGGDLNMSGGTGGGTGHNTAADASQSNILHLLARGGLAAGGYSTTAWFGTGNAGSGYGTGGTGASGGSLLAGGAGAPGLVVVRW